MAITKTKKVIIKSPKKAGRSTKYEGKKTIDKCNKFLKGCEVVAEREIKNESQTNTSYDISYTISTLPTKKKLARYLGISRTTLYEWERKYPEFLDIVEELSYIYEEILITNGLSGRFNSKITALLLSSKFGYADKRIIVLRLLLVCLMVMMRMNSTRA